MPDTDPVTKAELSEFRDHLRELRDADRRAIDASFLAAEKANAAALAAAERAVEKANTASERRFESVNEFRGQLSDMVNTLIPRHEAETRFKAFDERLSRIQSTVDKGFSGADASENTTRYLKGDNRASYAGYYALAGVALTVVIVVIAVMNLLTSK